MSFQAYLDNAERASGCTPQQLLDQAREQGFGQQTAAGQVLAWLATEHGLGRGHGMALVHVLKHGPVAPARHVGTDGPHRDGSAVLPLDGVAQR